MSRRQQASANEPPKFFVRVHDFANGAPAWLLVQLLVGPSEREDLTLLPNERFNEVAPLPVDNFHADRRHKRHVNDMVQPHVGQ